MLDLRGEECGELEGGGELESRRGADERRSSGSEEGEGRGFDTIDGVLVF